MVLANFEESFLEADLINQLDHIKIYIFRWVSVRP